MWLEFENALADRLRRMPRGDFLVLGHRDQPELYVQFRVDENGPLLGECRALDGSAEPEGQQSRLEELGWHSPRSKGGPSELLEVLAREPARQELAE